MDEREEVGVLSAEPRFGFDSMKDWRKNEVCGAASGGTLVDSQREEVSGRTGGADDWTDNLEEREVVGSKFIGVTKGRVEAGGAK